MMNLRERALNGIIAEAAFDNTGIYPLSVVGGENPYEKRSERQEGWNAHATALCEKGGVISTWLSTLGDRRISVENALLEGYVELFIEDSECSLVVHVGDVFFWAYSEMEDVEIDDLPDLYTQFLDSAKWGPIRWACIKRGMRPQRPMADEMKKGGAWTAEMEALPPRTDPGDHGWPMP
jgi:hypothetical protein